MRILMLCYEFPPLGGGGAGVVHGLSAQLVALGHEVDVVTMGYRGLPATETVEGVHVRRVPCVRLRETYCSMAEQATYLAGALPHVLRLVDARGYDINHTHFIMPDGVLALAVAALRGLPYVITSHGSDVPGYNPHRFRRAHRLLGPVWRRVVEESNGVISPSRTLESLVLKAKPDAQTTVIPNGIRASRLRADRPKQARILIVTRMFERKGVQHVLRGVAGSQLGREVHVVGEGPYLPKLKALAGELGVQAHFHGWLDRSGPELAQLYETSDIFVFPSEAENFPMVLLEAMSAGAAIVTTAGTGCAEVVGDAALLVPPRDPGAIRSALERLAADGALRARLGAAARLRLENHFTWNAVARRHVAYYEERLQALPVESAALAGHTPA